VRFGSRNQHVCQISLNSEKVGFSPLGDLTWNDPRKTLQARRTGGVLWSVTHFKAKTLHVIRETLEPYTVKMIKLVLGKASANNSRQDSLSNDTFKRQILMSSHVKNRSQIKSDRPQDSCISVLRWLSNGNFISCFFEWTMKIKLFSDIQKKDMLVSFISDVACLKRWFIWLIFYFQCSE